MQQKVGLQIFHDLIIMFSMHMLKYNQRKDMEVLLWM
jgi:hypothetical protein